MHSLALQAADERAVPVDIYPPTCYIRDKLSGLGAGIVTRSRVGPNRRSEGR